MDKHTVTDAQVSTLLAGHPGEENTRRLTERFSSADFEYTLNRVQIQARPELAPGWFIVLRKLRDERRGAETRADERDAAERRHADAELAKDQRLAAVEAANDRRHAELARRVDELKKPHWILWFTFVVAVLTLLVGALAWLFPRVQR